MKTTPLHSLRSLSRWTRFGSALASVAFALSTHAATVTVTIENLAPANGNYLTPVFVAFHDGSYDTFNPGGTASAGLEAIAEDGNTGPITAEFMATGAGSAYATVPGPNGPIAPGDKATLTFVLDGASEAERYFSFVSMVIPSNDAFIGNGNPLAFQIFDNAGNFLGLDRTVAGTMVWDAGTEVNDEVPANTAFFGQATPNTGVDQNGTIEFHAGFNLPGSGGILDSAMFAAADFLAPAYQVARITVVLADSDGDGVPDDLDACPDTAPGDIVNADGCSIAQICPCDADWRNHGHYVRCVVLCARSFLRAGLITRQQAHEIVVAAAKSDCGKRVWKGWKH